MPEQSTINYSSRDAGSGKTNCLLDQLALSVPKALDVIRANPKLFSVEILTAQVMMNY
jgi:hypothetical protein